MSEKIKAHHLERKAVLYVRQSSAFQVAHNQESSKLQYAMKSRLQTMGWREIEVVDEDLGRSASGTAERSGFQHMVAEVCLGKVGAVAAREASRFARNSRDWQQLVEVCRIVDTLLIDHETVYAPRRSNDRLLLGLKGSLNEYELDLLRQRSVEARRAKAQRGELVVAAPAGFIKTDDQRLEKDPDRRVQQAIALVFTKFLELGSVRQTLLWFLEHALQLPVYRPGGAALKWKRPTYHVIYRVLTHPIYGGAYAYGKTESSLSYASGQPQQSIRRKPRDQWLALIPHAHEGYVSWETFERIQKLIIENRVGEGWTGAAKQGAALLTGLLRCRRCGRKLTVSYTGNKHNVLRYCCHRGWLDNGEPRCIAFGGVPLDEAIAREVLRVVQPGATEAAVKAAEDADKQRDEVLAALDRDLEAARYQANRARKQYDAVDPENRLVADELEQRWNRALLHVAALGQRIAEETSEQQQHAVPTTEDFESLASDLESLWNDAGTPVRLKKRIVRSLIEEVLVDTDADAGEIIIVVHWKGGVHTELRLPRRRRGQNSAQTSKDIVTAVRILARIGSDNLIAGLLNRNGLRTGRGNRWTRERVASLRNWNKIPRHCANRQQSEGWMNLTNAAAYLQVSPSTLRKAVERGELDAEHPLSDGPWVFNKAELQSEAATTLVARVNRRQARPALPTKRQHNLDLSTT